MEIRNFSIIAHIDHGKSTLADRILEATGAISSREKKEQFLDKMDLERERGITIKAQTVRLNYEKDGKKYQLNLIDTPGHVDFHYEVSRSLSACEGAVLLVDATQGIQAQTMANALMAFGSNLEILPVINKVDLPTADVEGTLKQLEDVFGWKPEEVMSVSARTGVGVKELLDAIVDKLPGPQGDINKPLRALVFDSWFDNYLGAVVLVRVVDGKLSVGKNIRLMNSKGVYEIQKVGVFSPHPKELKELSAGEVGFIAANIKELKEVPVGDTITDFDNEAKNSLPGFKRVKPMVFAGFYPVDSDNYEDLRQALIKLQLNDASLSFEPETSGALGFGFRCGFLGSLHMEIVQERLEREYGIEIVTTAPTVVYELLKVNGEISYIENPAEMPESGLIEEFREPYAKVSIHTPSEYIGNVIKLCQDRRGEQEGIEYYGGARAVIKYMLPFAKMMGDFYDQLKTITRGYASLDYEIQGYRPANLIKMIIMLNGQPVDALSMILHKEEAYYRGRDVLQRIRGLIPRQMYDVAIQAAIGGKIIARETVKALRKDVTAKCYGGDVTRKRKLLEKQKEGKKRMKMIGRVEVPQEVFMAVLRKDGDNK